jgi:hypothetical protein
VGDNGSFGGGVGKRGREGAEGDEHGGVDLREEVKVDGLSLLSAVELGLGRVRLARLDATRLLFLSQVVVELSAKERLGDVLELLVVETGTDEGDGVLPGSLVKELGDLSDRDGLVGRGEEGVSEAGVSEGDSVSELEGGSGRMGRDLGGLHGADGGDGLVKFVGGKLGEERLVEELEEGLPVNRKTRKKGAR